MGGSGMMGMDDKFGGSGQFMEGGMSEREVDPFPVEVKPFAGQPLPFSVDDDHRVSFPSSSSTNFTPIQIPKVEKFSSPDAHNDAAVFEPFMDSFHANEPHQQFPSSDPSSSDTAAMSSMGHFDDHPQHLYTQPQAYQPSVPQPPPSDGNQPGYSDDIAGDLDISDSDDDDQDMEEVPPAAAGENSEHLFFRQ